MWIVQVAAVYVYRSGAAHFDSEPDDDRAHANGYFPDRGRLAVHRNEMNPEELEGIDYSKRPRHR